MSFTALHRAMGAEPGPLTDALLDAAVSAGVIETGDLDWKSELPPARGLPQTDFPKDIAAMANSGGGVIVYGVRERQRAAIDRVDVGEFDEGYERALRAAAVTAISPPVFGLNVHRLGEDGLRAVVVEVPASVDGPHLVFRNDYFGAPVRNDSDTVWMRERQIEAMYRARFDERRNSRESLDALYSDAAAGRDTGQRAWFVAVARPRIPRARRAVPREDARGILEQGGTLALAFAGSGLFGVHPLENVDRLNPRPGLRRWVAANARTAERERWREAWVSLHHDGSVTLAAAAGGHRYSADGYLRGSQVRSVAIECGVADLMALVRASGSAATPGEYDVRVGIEWAGMPPLTVLATDSAGRPDDTTVSPILRYAPVDVSVNAVLPEEEFLWQVRDLAQDCVNQGGISDLLLLPSPG